jgi:hypothetical protein
VPISNGAFGDDIGIGDVTAEQQKRVIELFNERKQKRMDISWIEEEPWNPKYQGKEVEFKWNLWSDTATEPGISSGYGCETFQPHLVAVTVAAPFIDAKNQGTSARIKNSVMAS